MLVLRVRCPKCGYEFNTKTIKTVVCKVCGRSFKVYYKQKIGFRKYVWRSRIVRIVRGSKIELFKKFEELKLRK